MSADEKDSWSLVGNRMDGTELCVLLESKDIHIFEDVKALIHENLNNSRETWLLYALVDYCMTIQSNRCLEILVGVREPHDKHLFDKLAECLKSDSRDAALLLLGHLVRKQPSWLHKIATHKIFVSLLNLLKYDTNAPTLMNGLLIIVTLLPIIPSLVASHIDDIFEIFTILCAWSTKKPGNVPEVYFLHLRVALYALFHRLYAMFPCNFLGFLRLHYGSRDHTRDNGHVFNETIKPMLERVRLHPLLVTASKETEFTTARWKNLEPHDIIVQCSKISLDEIEGVQENCSMSPWIEMASNKTVSQNLMVKSNKSPNVPVERGSLMAEMMEQLNAGTAASQLSISDLSPPNQENANSIQDILDIQENLLEIKDRDEIGDQDNNTKMNSQDSCEGSQEMSKESTEQNSLVDVVQAEEAKEEGQPKATLQASKECQFLSTTDTLTTSIPFRLDCDMENNSLKNKDQELNKDLEISTNSESNDASTVLIERLVHGINRLRFFSHCGHPPDIPIEWLRRPSLLKKSHSWPDLTTHMTISKDFNSARNDFKLGSPTTSSTRPCFGALETTPESPSIPDSPTTALPPSDFPIPIQDSWADTSGTILIPDIPQPQELSSSLPDASVLLVPCNLATQQSSSQLAAPERPNFSLLSPVEVLDRHLQLGSEIYLKELRSISLASMKDTDWTHFGGPPPVDELNILRGQISLLHMQLLFERHRCEVHAERNRRLLGKSKKARALEEQNLAMKDQLSLQETELHQLIEKLHSLQKKLDQQSLDVDYKHLHNSLRKEMQENHQLESTNKELKAILDTKKNESEKLSKSLDESRGSLLEAEFELKVLRQKADCYNQLEDKMKMFTRKLVVLQELHQRHVEKNTLLPKPPDLSFELQQFRESAVYETEELKHVIRSQQRDSESYKMRLECFEEQLNAKDLVIAELKDLLESIKFANADSLRSKELHIKTLQRMWQQQEEHIMKLKHKLCVQEASARPVATLFNRDDGNLSYPLNWHPAQHELRYGLSLPEDANDPEIEAVTGSYNVVSSQIGAVQQETTFSNNIGGTLETTLTEKQ